MKILEIAWIRVVFVPLLRVCNAYGASKSSKLMVCYTNAVYLCAFAASMVILFARE